MQNMQKSRGESSTKHRAKKKGKAWLYGWSTAAVLAAGAIYAGQAAIAETAAPAVLNPAQRAEVDKADITDMKITFTDNKWTQTLTDNDEIPRNVGDNSTRQAVGAEVSFKLDTSGYAAGDTVKIPRRLTANGEKNTTLLVSIHNFEVMDDSGNILGTINAADGGDLVFTLSEYAVKSPILGVSVKLPTVMLTYRRFADIFYNLTLGDVTIALKGTGNHYLAPVNGDKSKDGTSTGVDSSTDRSVSFTSGNHFFGHVTRQESLTAADYDNAASGIISNMSSEENGKTNTIASVKLNSVSKAVSFWSKGKQYYVWGISLVGNTAIESAHFFSGPSTLILKDASHKLAGCTTQQQAEDALLPGEWGSIDLGGGNWLWAYKTGDPSEGYTLFGNELVAALKTAGVEMTAEDEQKTREQKEFVPAATVYFNVNFSDATINGVARNTMGEGKVKDGSTLIPGASSAVTSRTIVTYYDDTTGLSLDVHSEVGTPGADIPYSTADRIKQLEDMGYIKVSDKYPTSPKFGALADSPDEYEVHFIHRTKVNTEAEEVTRTIHYVDEKGKTVAPDKTETMTFERTITKDLVDDKLSTASDWTPADGSFDEVTSPIFENYSEPSILVVGAVTGLTSASEDIVETVVYKSKTEEVSENKAVNQIIHYIYEDGGKAAPDSIDRVSFARSGTKNLAAGETEWNDWLAENEDTSFEAVNSPEIAGYTADKTSIAETTGLTAESADKEHTVTYRKDSVTAPPSKEKPGTPVKPIAATKQSQPRKAVLPSTGEKKTSAVVIGAALAASAAVLATLSHLRKKS
jgi:LPXTG-motif cell wall-anchored protein